MREITLRELLEAGCHFGHQSRRWHPKAAPYIFTERDGIHIIDLAKTKEKLEEAGRFAESLGRSGKIIIFVGTKRQAKAIVAKEAERSGAMYLARRWIGGLLTNWDQVKKNLLKLQGMRRDKDSGAWQAFPKHEQVKLAKELIKLEDLYGGVADLKNMPDALFLIDLKNENAAFKEAERVGIAALAISDTNTDPTAADYPIPANDDAVGSIEFIVRYIADAYLCGRETAMKEKIEDQEEKSAPEKPKEEKPKEKRETKTREKSKEKREKIQS